MLSFSLFSLCISFNDFYKHSLQTVGAITCEKILVESFYFKIMYEITVYVSTANRVWRSEVSQK